MSIKTCVFKPFQTTTLIPENLPHLKKIFGTDDVEFNFDSVTINSQATYNLNGVAVSRGNYVMVMTQEEFDNAFAILN